MTTEHNNSSRRPFIKKTIAVGIVPLIGSALPAQWTKPIVNTIILPAHAQTSVTSIVFTSSPVCGTSQDLQQDISVSAQVLSNPGAGVDVTFTVTCNATPSTSGSFVLATQSDGSISLAMGNGQDEGCIVGDMLGIVAELDGVSATCEWLMT